MCVPSSIVCLAVGQGVELTPVFIITTCRGLPGPHSSIPEATTLKVAHGAFLLPCRLATCQGGNNCGHSKTWLSSILSAGGHRTRSVFDRYNIVSGRDVREAMRETQAYLESAPTERTVLPFRQAPDGVE